MQVELWEIPPWRDRWTFYEAVNIPFEITVCTNPAMEKKVSGLDIIYEQCVFNMGRALRIECPGALYHV
jgi:hypothetical protein